MAKRNLNGLKAGAIKRRCTIYDVARHAGVSAATVSNVLNGTAPISEETRSSVLRSVQELGYTRNENARALRTANSKIIGIVLQDISSEYYAQCTARILQRAQEESYAVLTTDAHFSPRVLKTGVSALVNRCVNGLIFVGGSHDHESYMLAHSAGVPIVFGDRYVEGFPCVQFNNRETVYKLVHALYRQGYREFCYYGEALISQQNLEQRFGGFQDAMLDLGIPDSDYEVILQSDLNSSKMKKAFHYFQQWFLKTPKAERSRVILTSNDMIAQGVISATLRAGLRVPEDVAVFGFDNISISMVSMPSISTVAQDPSLLGDKCFEMLLQEMRNPGKQIENLMLEQQIVLRESVDLDAENALLEGLILHVEKD